MSAIARASTNSAHAGYGQKDDKGAQVQDDEKTPTPPSWDVERGTTQVLAPKMNPLQRFAYRLEEVSGMEARGIERVLEVDRKPATTWDDYVQMWSIWFSANLTLNNLLAGLFGPTLFQLSMKESMIIGPFGVFVGSACSGYTSSFGPMSGNRTLVSKCSLFIGHTAVLTLPHRLRHVTRWDGGHHVYVCCSTSSLCWDMAWSISWQPDRFFLQ